MLTHFFLLFLSVIIFFGTVFSALFENNFSIMKQFIIFLAALSLVGNAMAADLNKTDKKGRKQGEWVKTYQNGRVQYKGKFVDDKPVGTFNRYYEDGKLQSVQVYDAGNTSDVTFYEVDGKTVATVGHFDGKTKVGEWKYYSAGVLVMTEVFLNGQRHGLAKSYSNGVVIEETPYVNGLINGVQKKYLENGKLYSTTTYKNGVMEGAYRLYEGNANPVEVGQFKNGKRSGEWELYDEKGNKIDGTSYTGGVADNEKQIRKENSKQFDVNDNISKSGKYDELDKQLNGSRGQK